MKRFIDGLPEMTWITRRRGDKVGIEFFLAMRIRLW